MANVVHSTLTAADLHYSKIQTISGPPSTIPNYVGQSVFDTLNKVFYVANGVSSISDWLTGSACGLNVQSGTTYTVMFSDNESTVSLTNTAARAVTLLSTPMNGFCVRIKDEAGTAYSANIIITASGSDTFLNGTNTDIISSEYACNSYQYDAANSKWIIV